MSEELKNCPFCGSEAKVDDIIGRYAYCPNSDCHLWRLEGEEIEIDEWQSRPIEYALRKQLDMAVEAIKQFLERMEDEKDTSMDTTLYVIDGLRDALAEIEKIGG